MYQVVYQVMSETGSDAVVLNLHSYSGVLIMGSVLPERVAW
jgi:hypothetical protein